jgi:pyruvate-formate lyase-activating enzyme
MDIKHTLNFNLYNKTTGNILSRKVFEEILQSISIIQHSGVPYEFRTTIAKGLHSPEHIHSLKQQFGTTYKVHNYSSDITLATNCPYSEFSPDEFLEFQYG